MVKSMHGIPTPLGHNPTSGRGITEFTISSTFSSLIQTLAEFEKHGFRMNGLTEVSANYTDFTTGKLKVVPAIRMSLN